MTISVGPQQPYPILNAIAASIDASSNSNDTLDFWVVWEDKDKNGNILSMELESVTLDIKGLNDTQIAAKAVKHFTPMFLGGIRICVTDQGQSVLAVCLAASKNKITNPVADYDRAMAIVGRR